MSRLDFLVIGEGLAFALWMAEARMAHIVAHLSVEELGARSCASEDACLARHYQAIWLLAQGRRLSEVADHVHKRTGRKSPD